MQSNETFSKTKLNEFNGNPSNIHKMRSVSVCKISLLIPHDQGWSNEQRGHAARDLNADRVRLEIIVSCRAALMKKEEEEKRDS